MQPLLVAAGSARSRGRNGSFSTDPPLARRETPPAWIAVKGGGPRFNSGLRGQSPITHLPRSTRNAARPLAIDQHCLRMRREPSFVAVQLTDH